MCFVANIGKEAITLEPDVVFFSALLDSTVSAG